MWERLRKKNFIKSKNILSNTKTISFILCGLIILFVTICFPITKSVEVDGETNYTVSEGTEEAVNSFIEAVNKIPEDINKDNAMEVSEYVYGEVAEKYEAILGTPAETQEEVINAVNKMQEAIAKIDALLHIDSSILKYETITGGASISGNTIVINPSRKPSDYNSGVNTIGSDGKLNMNGGTVSKKVGESGFYMTAPQYDSTYNYLAVGYTQLSVTYDTDIIKETSYSVGVFPSGYPGAGKENLRLNYVGKKPGTSTITLEYYANFLLNVDMDWHKNSTYFTVNVTADYKLNYNANGGSGEPSSSTYTNVTYDTRNFIVSNVRPIRSGYTFIGWNTKADGTGESYKAGDRIKVDWQESDGASVERTLYAVWAENPTISKEIMDKKDYYRPGDVVQYAITVTNHSNFNLTDVNIEEKNEQASIVSLLTNIIDDLGEDEILSDTTVKIGGLRPKEVAGFIVEYKVKESDFGVIKNEAALTSGTFAGDITLDANSINSAIALFKTFSQLKICEVLSGRSDKTEPFRIKVASNSYESWLVLNNGDCNTLLLKPGDYNIKEILPQEYELESVTGSITGNNSVLEVKELEKYEVTFTNVFKRKGFYHSNGRVVNTISSIEDNLVDLTVSNNSFGTGDGIPDKYQVEIIYEGLNGYVTDNNLNGAYNGLSKPSYSKVITLRDEEGNFVESGTITPGVDGIQLIPINSTVNFWTWGYALNPEEAILVHGGDKITFTAIFRGEIVGDMEVAEYDAAKDIFVPIGGYDNVHGGSLIRHTVLVDNLTMLDSSALRVIIEFSEELSLKEGSISLSKEDSSISVNGNQIIVIFNDVKAKDRVSITFDTVVSEGIEAGSVLSTNAYSSFRVDPKYTTKRS